MPLLNSVRLLLCVLLLLAGVAAATTDSVSEPLAPPQPAQSGQAWQLELRGVIGPASSDLLRRTLEQAADAPVHLLLLTMDTPGGLDQAMRSMIQAIINSPVPVATYVFPGGARAASAGTYLLYASHIAAMAPATNLGAATPVQIGMPATPRQPGGDEEDKQDPNASLNAMQKKIINDAVAYIRGLAELHGRNADWAEKAVREAASLDAREALEQQVVDIVAQDVPDLLAQLDGRVVKVQNRDYTLHTAQLQLSEIVPDWRHEFLTIITNPNVAYILMLLGVYGLLMEFYNPGVGLPGIIGGISLITALYAFQLLPISYAGLALLALGIALMIAEALSPSFGILGFGGVVAFAFGSVLLIDSELPAFQIALPVIAAFSVFTAGVCIFALAMALRSRKAAVVSGTDMLIGQQALALNDFNGGGKVQLNGEIWNARSRDRIRAGSRVEVIAIEGLLLDVALIDSQPPRGDS